MEGMRFFDRFSLLHILWIVWMSNMILQMIPLKNFIALGSQKLFKRYYRSKDADKSVSKAEKHNFIRKSNKGAAAVMVIWMTITAAIGFLFKNDLINRAEVLLISVFFYICDLICVVIWCPFRAIFMKNKCCSTCRIFNWDHFMMFSPLVWIGGFYAYTLFIMAFIVFAVWEIQFYRYPERFWEKTNRALTCVCCTDRLCAAGIGGSFRGKKRK